MTVQNEYKVIVIDIGSSTIKVGFAGDASPKVVIPAVIGRRKSADAKSAPVYVGEKALANSSLNLSWPIEFGLVKNYDDLMFLLSNVFNVILNVKPEEYAIFITETPSIRSLDRETMIKKVFDTFNCRAYGTSTGAVLSLYATGRTSGIVLQVGDTVTHTVPIYDGYVVPHAVLRNNIGGQNVTNHLIKLLSEPEYDYTPTARRSKAEEVKEKLCYVPLNDEDEDEAASVEAEPFDEALFSEVIYLGKGFECPAMLFQPSLFGSESTGVAEMVFNSIMKCDVDIRKDLYANIVLDGGSTLFSGMTERMQKEITEMAPSSITVKVVAPPERKYLQWIGGSVLASLSTFPPMLILREEYKESGPSIVHTRMF